MSKQRLSVTVDSELVDAAMRAVAAGRSSSVSAWVNDALRRQLEHEERLKAGEEVWEAWQAEFGAVSDEEMERVHQELMARALKPKGKTRTKTESKKAPV